MQKLRGRKQLTLQPDIFCLILKGKLTLTVKSISNQDWNLIYDHGQWTPYSWSHKWCHISALLWLPIFGSEMPILIKNFNLKDKVSLADSEKYSFVLLLHFWGSVQSRSKFTSCSALSHPFGKTMSKVEPKIYIVKASLMKALQQYRSWAGLWGWRSAAHLCIAQSQSILCTSNTTLLELGSPLGPTQYHRATPAHALNQLYFAWFCY